MPNIENDAKLQDNRYTYVVKTYYIILIVQNAPQTLYLDQEYYIKITAAPSLSF